MLGGCSSHQLDLEALSSASDQVVWEAGQKAVEKKDWESARQYYRRLIDAFPQSEHQADARIAVADSYFEEGGTGNYVLAVSAYREFLTLYPQHPKSDYAQFRAAESYFKQKNSPDRDQTATEQALEEYQRLLDVYTESPWVEPAREKIRECRQTLARSHHLVGYFYQKTRKSWRSAIGRYETILSEYPDYEHLDEVLFRLGECPRERGPLRRGPAPPGAAPVGLPREPLRGRGEEGRGDLPASRGSRGRSGRRPGRSAQPATSRPPPPRADRRPAPDLKCHFEDSRKDLLTNSLFS